MKSFFRILLGALVLAGAHSYAQTPWIIGGTTAAQGQFPWVGSITLSGSHYCGAALIDSRWAITAGHCAYDYRTNTPLQLSATKIRFNSLTGRGTVSTGGVQVAIKKCYPFPSFDISNFAAGYDICLVELATPVTTVTPIALPAMADTASLYATGNQVRIAGWGLQDTFSFTAPNELKWCTTRVFDFALCDMVSVSSTGTQLTPDVFCAGYQSGEPSAGAAAGDSGGPIWKEDSSGNKTLLGVVSGGFGPTTLADLPGYFTKAAVYRPWIDSIMAASPTAISPPVWTDDQVRVGAAGTAITITFSQVEADQVRILLYDVTGRAVYDASIEQPAGRLCRIDNQTLPAGLYVLRISGAGRSFTKKLLNTGY